jgi:hypothetical protein
MVALMLVATSGAQAQRSADSTTEAPTSLVAAERAFARDATVRTVNEAILAVLSDSAILFRPTPVPGRTSLGDRPLRATLSLMWAPIYAETSSDGLFGFDVGLSAIGERGQPPTVTGFFFSVWRRAGGVWRLESDCGINSPIPVRPERAAPLLTARTTNSEILDARQLWDVEQWLIADYKRRFARLADDDARVYRDGTTPTTTRGDAIALVDRDMDVEQSVLRVEVAGSGELGYAIGVLDPNGPSPRGYQRMYRHGKDGTWRIAVDCRP